MRRRIIRGAALALCVLSAAYADALSTTTTTGGVGPESPVIQLASTSGAAVGYEMYLDREAMVIIGVSTDSVTVRRGQEGTAARSHASGASVWVGPSRLFSYGDLTGSGCTSRAAVGETLLAIRTGSQWTCGANDVWGAATSSSGGWTDDGTTTSTTRNAAIGTTVLEGDGISAVNVKAKGAKGDDSTDDTTAIQAAVTAASAAGGGVVFLPPGTYKTTLRISIPSNVTLAGAGQGISILHETVLPTCGTVANSNTDYDNIIITGSSVTVRDMTIRGPAGASPAYCSGARGQKGISVQPASTLANTLVENVTVEQVQANGIQIWTGAAGFVGRNLRITDTGGEGIYITYASGGNYFIDTVYVARVPAWAIDINEGRGIIRNYIIENCGSAGLIGDGGGVTVTLDPSVSTYAERVQVLNGTISGTYGNAIEITAPDNAAEVVSQILIDGVQVVNADRAKMTTGISTRSSAGAIDGLIIKNAHLSNASIGLQAVSNGLIDGVETTNTLALGGADDGSTAGIYIDTGSFGPVTVSNSTAIGWKRGGRFQSCTGPCSFVNVVATNNTVAGIDCGNAVTCLVAAPHATGSPTSHNVLGGLILSSTAQTWAELGGMFPSYGSTFWCSDCDAPAAPGNSCTSAGAKAGAEAHWLRGAWKCF